MKKQIRNKKNKLKVMLLGGAEEVGINGTVVEYGGDILIIDMGFGFPGDELYGVDYLIPNVEYLKKNKKRIKGIIVTHGHLDHIGGIPYVLEDLGFPKIYSRKLTLELIKPKLEEFNLLSRSKLVEVSLDKKLQLGSFELGFFGINHNIPESMGVAVKSPDGTIVHTGDYKFDDTPVNEPVSEYGKITDLGEEGVLLAMCDSTNSMRKGRSVSESEVTDALEEVIRYAKGRVIAATFASLITRISQLITLGIKYNKKIAISGYGMRQTVDIAKKLGYIKADEKHFVDAREIDKYDDKQILFICTGSQGEEMAALARMSRKEHRDIKVKKGDTILLSSSVIPSNTMAIQQLIDDLTRLGADVVHQSLMDVHAGGHAYQDDQRMMLNMLNPRFFMPIQGHLSFLHAHAKTAMGLGMKESDIIIPENGQLYEFNGKTFVKGNKVPSEPILVSGKSIGNVGEYILREREQLANNGMIVLGVNLNASGLLDEPVQLITRGFVYTDPREVLLSEVSSKVQDIVQEKHAEGAKFNAEYKEDLRKRLEKRVGRMIRKQTNRNPVVLPVFV